MSLSVFTAILAVAAALVISFFAAGEFYKAATAKGWNSRKYFWLCFLLTFVGYLLVIALPDRGGQQLSAIVSDDLPEL